MKKRKPQDITLRNLRAMKKRHIAMEKYLEAKLRLFDCWIDRVRELEERVEFLERKNAFKISNEATKQARRRK